MAPRDGHRFEHPNGEFPTERFLRGVNQGRSFGDASGCLEANGWKCRMAPPKAMVSNCLSLIVWASADPLAPKADSGVSRKSSLVNPFCFNDMHKRIESCSILANLGVSACLFLSTFGVAASVQLFGAQQVNLAATQTLPTIPSF